MGHSIRGFVARPASGGSGYVDGAQHPRFVARPETLQAVRARFPGAKLVTLDAGFAWVPATTR